MIASIRGERPAYNLITNNCQTYALQLLDAIKVGGQKEFATTAAVYDRLFGPGKVMDLFAKPPDGQEIAQGQNSVSLAQQVMDQNTTQLDPKEESKKRLWRKEKKDKQEVEDDSKRGEDDMANRQHGGEEREKKEKTDYKEKVFSFFSRDKKGN